MNNKRNVQCVRAPTTSSRARMCANQMAIKKSEAKQTTFTWTESNKSNKMECIHYIHWSNSNTILYAIKHCLINRHEHHNCFDCDWSRVLCTCKLLPPEQTHTEREGEKNPLQPFYVSQLFFYDWLRSPSSKHCLRTHTHTLACKHSRKCDLYAFVNAQFIACNWYVYQQFVFPFPFSIFISFHFISFSSHRWFMMRSTV